MGWLKLDDLYDDHPKIVGLHPLAELLDVRGMLYGSRLKTDGFVPRGQLEALGRRIPAVAKKVAELVAAGRWHDGPSDCCPDPGGKGWWIHDFLVYNPSRAERDNERAAAAERMAKARANKNPRSKNVPANKTAGSPEVRANTPDAFARTSLNPIEDRSGNPVPSPPHVPSEHMPPAGADAPRGDPVPANSNGQTPAQRLLAGYIAACKVRPPDGFLGPLSAEVKRLVGQGYSEADIATALEVIRRKGLHHTSLPSVLNEFLNADPAADRGARRTREQQTSDDIAAYHALADELTRRGM